MPQLWRPRSLFKIDITQTRVVARKRISSLFLQFARDDHNAWSDLETVRSSTSLVNVLGINVHGLMRLCALVV